jgi:hypothetical protein
MSTKDFHCHFLLLVISTFRAAKLFAADEYIPQFNGHEAEDCDNYPPPWVERIIKKYNMGVNKLHALSVLNWMV